MGEQRWRPATTQTVVVGLGPVEVSCLSLWLPEGILKWKLSFVSRCETYVSFRYLAHCLRPFVRQDVLQAANYLFRTELLASSSGSLLSHLALANVQCINCGLSDGFQDNRTLSINAIVRVQ